MKHILLPFIILLFAEVSLAQIPATIPNEQTWTTDRACKVAYASGTVYLYGNDYYGNYFSRVGPFTGRGVPFMAATGQPAAVYPKVDGMVRCCLPDGYGGWYIGGHFQNVGNTPREHLAHILHDGRVDEAWNPGAGGVVVSLVRSGTRLYIGGSFTYLGGQSRAHLAAVDAPTGALDPWNPIWNPNLSGTVIALAASGGTIYAGGDFTTISGQSRRYLAAFNAATGALASFNPGASDRVCALLVSGSTLYAGGDFTTIGGQTRHRLAAMDTSTGAVTAWNGGVIDGIVYALGASGTMVYAGGSFTQVGGQGRNNLAALDAVSGALGAWNPDADRQVMALAIAGSTIYVGGNFTHVGGQARANAASLDLISGAAGPWQPEPSGVVRTLAAAGSKVYAGGDFTLCGGVERNGLAALDPATGQPTPWNPDPSGGGVSALVRHGSTVYVGGDFTSIGGANRNHIAALDAVTGNATAWNPNADDSVTLLAVKAPVIYAAGKFSNIGGQTRNKLAALDLATGLATAWDAHPKYDGYPPPSVPWGMINTMAVSDSQVYVGGDFHGIGGAGRNCLAALDPVTGTASPWNPKPSFPYRDPELNDDYKRIATLALSGSTLYVSGLFDNIGGQTRYDFAALDTVTSHALPFNLSLSGNGQITVIAINSQTMYLGGWFYGIGGQARDNLAAVDLATGSVLPWTLNLAPFANVWSLVPTSNALYIGGGFKTLIDGRANFAQYVYANPGRLAASPASLEFRKGSGFEVDVERGGAPTTRTLTLTNTGDGPVELTSLPIIQGRCAGDYAIDSIAPSPYAPIPAGASVTIIVRFAPTSTQRTIGLDAYLLVTTDSLITPTINVPLLGDAVPVSLSGFSIK